MSTFEVKVVQVSIEPHDNADTLEIANVKGYQCIVRKGEYKTGDTAIYIPEQAIVPKNILQEMNLWDENRGKGKLAGNNGDRVTAVKLRGKLSQGLLYPNTQNFPVGAEVSSELGIVKWEPPIPTQMDGQVANLSGFTLKYDIENIKNHPEVVDFLIKNRVEVEITEKIHGSWVCFGLFPKKINPDIFCHGTVVITSKGLSAKGLAFTNVHENSKNLYVRKFYELFGNENVLFEIRKVLKVDPEPVFFLGEIFGAGVQDLNYGMRNETGFRLFDVYQGYPGRGRYLTPEEIDELQNAVIFPNMERVPMLYKGPLTQDVIARYTDGMNSISGSHIREGIVIKPYTNNPRMSFDELDRVILKSVSESYLMRKNGTEYQ